jgi:hypothetical protein
VSEVVVLGHRVRLGVAAVGRQVEALVEHVVLEARHAHLGDEPGDLRDVLRGHRREVEAVVDAGVARDPIQHLGEDLAVGPALVQVVLAGAEVGDGGGHAAHRRRGRLALGVLGDVAVDAEMEVAVHPAGKHGLPARVEHLVRVGGIDALFQRGDPLVANADVEAQLADVRDHHQAVLDHKVEAGHLFLLETCHG